MVTTLQVIPRPCSTRLIAIIHTQVVVEPSSCHFGAVKWASSFFISWGVGIYKGLENTGIRLTFCIETWHVKASAVGQSQKFCVATSWWWIIQSLQSRPKSYCLLWLDWVQHPTTCTPWWVLALELPVLSGGSYAAVTSSWKRPFAKSGLNIDWSNLASNALPGNNNRMYITIQNMECPTLHSNALNNSRPVERSANFKEFMAKPQLIRRKIRR